MDHVADAADEVDRIEHLDGLGAVGHCYGHLVALAHADGAQCLGAVLDLADKGLVGGRSAHEVKGNVVGVFFGYFFNGFKHRAVEVIEREGHFAQMAFPRRFCADVFHANHSFKKLKIYKFVWP